MGNSAENYQDVNKLFYILLIALLAGCIKVNDPPQTEEDAALVSLLNELDRCHESGDREKRNQLYSQLAAEYEKKNLTELHRRC